MAQFTTLSSSDIQGFERDGFVVVSEAFARADALAMERRWWSELAAAHDVRPDDRSGWRQVRGDLKAAKRDPIQRGILTDRVRGVFDDLLGEGTWSPPKDWGRAIAAFPGRATGMSRPGSGTGTAPRSRTWTDRGGSSSSASSGRSRRAAAAP